MSPPAASHTIGAGDLHRLAHCTRASSPRIFAIVAL
jgi:hypothetical protein